jgi:ribulose 1,5-bisphosphate synthetase/thiazole synthase
MDSSKLLLESKLTEKISTDVCIVGAGIAGMSGQPQPSFRSLRMNIDS